MSGNNIEISNLEGLHSFAQGSETLYSQIISNLTTAKNDMETLRFIKINDANDKIVQTLIELCDMTILLLGNLSDVGDVAEKQYLLVKRLEDFFGTQVKRR